MSAQAPALILRGEVTTHEALQRQVSVATGRLRRLGVTAGARVGLWAENGPEWVAIALALFRSASVLVPLNARLSNAEIEWQIGRAGLPLVIASNELAGCKPGGCRVVSFEEWGALAADEHPPESGSQDPGRDAAIVFTSGTSGRPKGAILTWANLLASARASAAVLPLAPGDRWLASLPFFHVGGLGILVRCSLAGACVVIPDSFAAADLDDAIGANGVTHVSLVDATLRRLLEARGGEALPAHLRVALVGGGPVGARLIDNCVQALATYGLTETCSMVTVVRPGATGARRRTSGPALPGVELRIGSDGMIEIRGSMVMRAYLDDAQATRAAFRDGWLRTGDLGEIDPDGSLRVLDRREDLIVSGGENVYPAEILRVLREHPQVEDAMVIGVADESWGQVPLALVVTRTPDVADLRPFLEKRLARFKIPRIVRVGSIPRLANGKPDQAAVRRQYGSRNSK